MPAGGRAAGWAAPLLLALALAGRAGAAEPGYTVALTGEGSAAVADTVKQVSELMKRAGEQPAPPPEILRRRADRDRETIGTALRALGYYDDHVEAAIDAEARPPAVTLTVEPGPLYRIGPYDVTETLGTGTGGAPPRVAIDRKALGVPPGTPAAGSTIVEAERKLTGLYAAAGHPWAKAADRRVVIDHATRSAAVAVTVSPGPEARVGAVGIEGLERTSPDFVRRRLAVKTGDRLTSTAIDKTRTALVESGLFGGVRVEFPPEPPAAGAPATTVPVTVALTERPHHSIGAGLNYSTNFGPGATATWEDRNLFHDGQKLSATGAYAQRQQRAALNYRQPDLFGDVARTGLLGLEYRDEQTVRRLGIRRFAATGAIEQRFRDIWTINYGLSLEEAHVTRRAGETDEHLIGLPVTLTRDSTGDLLNPSHGTRLTLAAAPYLPVADQPAFLLLRARESAYWTLDEAGAWVGAVWGEVGSILGARRGDIPFSRRFYAGGGSSIRGYGYQLAGPLDRFKDPVGGASSLQLGSELRIRITESIGLVPFVEAGNVYRTSVPTDRGHLFAGGGLGVRYYTPIGPIRLDLATPFYRRPGIDDPIQVYISLGQAF